MTFRAGAGKTLSAEGAESLSARENFRSRAGGIPQSSEDELPSSKDRLPSAEVSPPTAEFQTGSFEGGLPSVRDRLPSDELPPPISDY